MKTNSILKKLFSKKGKGRAFKNQRKSKKGRIRQQIAMEKDMFGNIHYKVICHIY